MKNSVCQKCNYERTDQDNNTPIGECPKCGIIFEKYCPDIIKKIKEREFKERKDAYTTIYNQYLNSRFTSNYVVSVFIGIVVAMLVPSFCYFHYKMKTGDFSSFIEMMMSAILPMAPGLCFLIFLEKNLNKKHIKKAEQAAKKAVPDYLSTDCTISNIERFFKIDYLFETAKILVGEDTYEKKYISYNILENKICISSVIFKRHSIILTALNMIPYIFLKVSEKHAIYDCSKFLNSNATIQTSSYKINKYDNSIINNNTNISGMIIGGLLFGVLGAVIGANSCSNKATTTYHQETKSYLEPIIIKIVVDDLNNPVVSIVFSQKSTIGDTELNELNIVKQARFFQMLLELIIMGVKIPKGITYEKLEGLREWLSVKFQNNDLSREIVTKTLSEALNSN